MRRRFSEAQILNFLREAASGVPVIDLCWNHCISRSTFRAWKAKYGETMFSATDRVAQLERENARLRKALLDAQPDLLRPHAQGSEVSSLASLRARFEPRRVVEMPVRRVR